MPSIETPESKITRSLSLFDFNHMITKHGSFYKAGLHIIEQLKNLGVDAKITTGGIDMDLTENQEPAVAALLLSMEIPMPNTSSTDRIQLETMTMVEAGNLTGEDQAKILGIVSSSDAS